MVVRQLTPLSALPISIKIPGIWYPFTHPELRKDHEVDTKSSLAWEDHDKRNIGLKRQRSLTAASVKDSSNSSDPPRANR